MPTPEMCSKVATIFVPVSFSSNAGYLSVTHAEVKYVAFQDIFPKQLSNHSCSDFDEYIRSSKKENVFKKIINSQSHAVSPRSEENFILIYPSTTLVVAICDT